MINDKPLGLSPTFNALQDLNQNTYTEISKNTLQ